MAYFLKCLILGMIFLASAGSAMAAGAVLEAIGGAEAVAVKRAGKEILLKKGEALQVGDEVRTDGSTAVDIRFQDKSIVRVGANSIYKLEEDSKVKNLFHRLVSGIVRVIVPPSANGKDGPVRFRMDTPEGTIGVRGTEFVVIASKDQTTLKGFEGEVMFGPAGADFSKADQFVMVTEKLESSVRKNGKPSQPKEFDRTKYLREIDGKGGVFGAVASVRKSENFRQRSVAPAIKTIAVVAAEKPIKVKALSKKAEIKKPVKADPSPGEALFAAAAAGDIPAAGRALKKGAEINGKDEDGHTALHAATLYSRREMVTFLAKEGADVNVKNKLGETPLMLVAAETGHGGIAVDLIDLGARASEKNSAGMTALEMARLEFAKTTDAQLKVQYQELIELLEGEPSK